ncbi:MAG: hypothetical protein L6R40_007276 [Gallowayella cf. fulva]|nr:MAG: hypothetical protein L6R40_007276 [Xanthomendoza cf. fulva]
MADNSPALPPPPGRQPNFLHPDSLARWNVVCVSACLSITTLLFLLRSGVRLIIKRSWILEDYLVLISWVSINHHSPSHGPSRLLTRTPGWFAHLLRPDDNRHE